MKHYPSERAPVRIEGLEHTPAPASLSRTTAILLAAVLFFSGFFIGAIAFGEVLVHAAQAAASDPS